MLFRSIYDAGEEFVDVNSNKKRDLFLWYVDANRNGKWDSGDPFEDSNLNGKKDFKEKYTDKNNNGKYDPPEKTDSYNFSFNAVVFAEPFTDVPNGRYDRGEEFEDLNNDGKWTGAEEFEDLNDDGVWSPIEKEKPAETERLNQKVYKMMAKNCGHHEDYFLDIIHEGGHALYEQGILSENYGTPLGNSISLGIHESQSRLWENHVGRSLPYWKNNFKRLQSFFPNKLKNVNYKMFYQACNNVKSSLIRTEIFISDVEIARIFIFSSAKHLNIL